MVSEISPKDAALLAIQVYAAQKAPSADDFEKNSDTEIQNKYSLASGLIKMKTGIARNVGSAVVYDRGGTNGAEKVVAIRGTEFVSTDWLTNGSVGMTTSVRGHLTHAGFHKTYMSMIDDITKAVGTNPGHVHVIGHSLGGALATNVALHLGGSRSCSIYTFGAPRVGLMPYSREVTQVVEDRIFRAYDLADPVPMIPLWPFTHTPVPGRSIKVSEDRALVNPFKHMMGSYTAGIEKHKSWESARKHYATSEFGFSAADWLEKAGKWTQIPGAAWGLWALGKALDAILEMVKQSAKIGFTVVQGALSYALSVPDIIAFALGKAVEVAGEISEMVIEWAQLVMRWLGKAATTVQEVTTSFLRYLMDLVYRDLAIMAMKALRKLS